MADVALAAPIARTVTRPLSTDPATRTVVATLSTGRGVSRTGIRPDGKFGTWVERLDIAGADLSRAAGAAVLIDHVASSTQQIGIVERAWKDRGAIMAELRFGSGTLGDAYYRDIADGVKKQLSIGYSVDRWAADKAEPDIFEATSWRLYEVSVVAIGADPSAGFRSQPEGLRTMTVQTSTTAEGAPSSPTTDGARAGFGGTAVTGNGYQTPPVADPVALERERVAAIFRTGDILGLARDLADQLVNGGVPLEEARTRMLELNYQRSQATQINGAHGGHVQVRGGHSGDDPTTRRGHVVEALTHRLSGGATDLSEPARNYRGLSLVELGRALSDQPRGIFGLTRDAGSGGYHSTSDFPHLLGESGNRALLAQFQRMQPALVTVARRTTTPDFRPISRLRLGEAPALLPVLEDGEVKAASVGETKETYSVGTFGRSFGLTRQSIVNDDLGAFVDFLAMMSRSTAVTLGDVLYNILAANAVLSDGVPLAHGTHGNLAASGTAITVASLGAARTAMRKQIGVDGARIDLKPRFLVVGPDKETEAEQVLTSLAAATVSSVNPFAGKLELVVEPRLVGNVWYLFADPALGPTIEYAELDGTRPMSGTGPRLATEVGFDIDGVRYRVLYDVGAGAVGFQGVYRNPGA